MVWPGTLDPQQPARHACAGSGVGWAGLGWGGVGVADKDLGPERLGFRLPLKTGPLRRVRGRPWRQCPQN